MKSQSRKKDKNHTLLKEERKKVKVVKEERKGRRCTESMKNEE